MKTKAKNILYYLVNTVFPLMCGVVIYVIARPETIISQFIYNSFHMNGNNTIALPTFLMNYGCDFLWSYSLVHCIFWISRSYKFTLFVCISFNILAEVIQLLPFIRLVFDPIDILVEIIGVLIGLSFIFLYEYCVHSGNKHRSI